MALAKFFTIILSVLVGSSLLSGSSVAFLAWYSFPVGFSKFILIVITFHSCIKIGVNFFSFLEMTLSRGKSK